MHICTTRVYCGDAYVLHVTGGGAKPTLKSQKALLAFFFLFFFFNWPTREEILSSGFSHNLFVSQDNGAVGLWLALRRCGGQSERQRVSRGGHVTVSVFSVGNG